MLCNVLCRLSVLMLSCCHADEASQISCSASLKPILQLLSVKLTLLTSEGFSRQMPIYLATFFSQQEGSQKRVHLFTHAESVINRTNNTPTRGQGDSSVPPGDNVLLVIMGTIWSRRCDVCRSQKARRHPPTYD